MPGQKLFRCLNPECTAAKSEFEAETPVCPTCTAGQHDPRAVIEIQAVHYLVNTPLSVGPIKTGSGGRQQACRPGATKIPKHATGVAEAVTCPRCLETTVWKQHVEKEVDQHKPFIRQDGESNDQIIPAANVNNPLMTQK